MLHRLGAVVTAVVLTACWGGASFFMTLLAAGQLERLHVHVLKGGGLWTGTVAVFLGGLGLALLRRLRGRRSFAEEYGAETFSGVAPVRPTDAYEGTPGCLVGFAAAAMFLPGAALGAIEAAVDPWADGT